MSALTGGRNTKQYGVNKAVVDGLDGLQAANTKIYEGAIVAYNASGYVTPGATGLGLTAGGVAELTAGAVGNLSDSTGLADGILKVRVIQGVFLVDNSASTDLIALAQIGQLCYLVDDHTVAKTSGTGTRSLAGIVMDVTSAGQVWVAIGLQFSLAALQAQVNAVINGNPEEASASATLSVVKRTSRLTIAGTKAYVLPDGTFAGQRKTLFAVATTATPVGVVTPAHGSGFTTITFGATSANSSVELEWDTSLGTPAWKVVGVSQTAGSTLTIA